MPVSPEQLIGRWRFDRTITDRRTGVRGGAAGTAEFSMISGSRIDWSETGVLQWSGRRVPVGRALVLERAEQDWQVRFPDGNPFFDWDPGRSVVHHCGADRYVGELDFRSEDPPDAWSISWDVTGPAKDYTSITRLLRTEP